MVIDPNEHYPLKETAEFLKVSEATVAKYLRESVLEGKQIGPKKRWHALGRSILKLRKEWGYEDVAKRTTG